MSTIKLDVPNELKPMVVGVISGLVYGIVFRVLLAFDSEYLIGVAAVMTIGFLFVVPIVIGHLTVRQMVRPTWAQKICAPWLSVLGLLSATYAVGLEGLICIVFLIPLVFPLASIGGLATRGRASASVPATLGLMALPWVVMLGEHQLPRLDRTVEVVNEIIVAAPPSRVWPLVASVDSIRADELRPTFYSAIGFPRPVAAMIDRPGVGGVRTASFDGGVIFREVVTTWDVDRVIRFSIDAEQVPSGALDDHVTIGGPYFDVLDGGYRLEPVGTDSTRVILSSHHRVTTTFNSYAEFWATRVMSGIQEDILRIIQARAERQ